MLLRYMLAYYLGKAAELVALGVHILAIKVCEWAGRPDSSCKPLCDLMQPNLS